MHKDDVLSQLVELLSCFRLAEPLINELLQLIKEKGVEQKFFNTFYSRLEFLRQNRALATKHEEFESIGSGLFSMHISGKGFNVRILYSFLQDRSPILLLAFEERAGKRKTDYSRYIPVAKERLDHHRKEKKND